jgi:Inorganic Pyrophosphatase
MADFDPDAYLGEDTGNNPQQSGSFDPDAYLSGDSNGPSSVPVQSAVQPPAPRDRRVASEGSIASGVREFAHSVVPGIVGAAAAPFGAAAGSVVPVVGSFAGGAAAFIGGSMAAEYAQDKFLKAVGFDDDIQRAANREANPTASFAGGLAGGMATMSPVGIGESIGRQALQRGAGAVAMGGFEAGGEYLQGEDFDPTHIALAAGAGAVFPGVNKLGSTVQGPAERFLAGRPGRTANPAADQAHADVGDNSVETAVGDSVLAEAPPTPAQPTTGNPASAPERSAREYPKEAQSGAEPSQVTTGDMDPATAQALAEANPSPVQEPAPQAEAPAPAPAVQPQPAPVGPNAQKPRISLKRRPPPEPVVETGFPEPGEPHAVGENDATPMPPRAAEAVAKSKAAEAPPEIKGETVANDKLSDAQKAAGNYLKARTHDFGKPIAIETHAGDIRRSPEGHPEPWENTSPYEYGYFNKTVGPDGDHIDFMRPADGAPELGDKHFIIDQKDATTGKYDEPKVMTYVKDRDTAVDLYNRGFSDNKGPARMHDINEVSRGDLVKFLAKHTKNPPKGPYKNYIVQTPKERAAAAKKPVAERAVVQDLIAKGKTTPEAIAALPPEQVEAAIAGKRTRKYGVETGASAGYPVEGVVNSEGKPVTANTKAKAAERSGAHKAVSDWFEKSAPPSGEEANGDLLNRIKGHNYPTEKGAWIPAHKPKEWLLAREAKKLLAKPTPGNIGKFKEAERLLRGGPEDVEAYRGGNRVEADIAQSRRSGDEAVQAAENAQHLPGTNAEEDAIIERIDAMKEGKLNAEETEGKPRPVKSAADLKQLPRKTIHVSESPLAQFSGPKAEAAKLAGKKAETANVPSEEKPASPVRKPKISPEDMQRLVELSNKAAKKTGLSEEEIANQDLMKLAAVKPSDTASVKRLFEQFTVDVGGAVNVNKIRADLKRMLKTTPVKSHIARTPNTAREPHAEYTRGVSDELHKTSQADISQWLSLIEQMRALPKEADRDALERVYKAREADSAKLPLPTGANSHIDALSPADRKIYDEHLKPVFDENDAFFDVINALDPDRLGPKVEGHIARITKGDTSEYNMLKDRNDPTGPQYNGMRVNAAMAKERPFVALERVADGKRYVVQNKPEGFTLWDNYKRTQVTDPTYEFEQNQPYTVTAKNGTKIDYIMRNATADEIAANARGNDGKGKPMRYYQNAALSAMMTNAQMGSMARHLAELARISSTPKFKELTTTNRKTADEKGFIKTKLPNFEGTYMDPQLAHVMDDYAKPGFDSPQMWRDLNQGITKLLFWMPTAHIANVGAHWFVGRGFDNLNAKALYETGAKAIKSVMTQDAYQKSLRDAGAGTIYPSVLTRQFIEQVAKGVGEQFEKDPGRWGPLADKFGVPLGKLKDAIYNASSKVMWAANDMFLTQRVMELERKGHSMEEAIRIAERDIPNYRVPTTIMGSGQLARFISQLVQDPSIPAFGRYHYGMWNSYANIVRDAIGPNASAGDRVDAVGKMMAMGVLAYVIYPAMDKFAKLITGNEDATQQRRGPISVPYHLAEAAEGKEDAMGFARSTFTLQPLVSTLLETLFNRDFRGKNIVEPGDVRRAFHGEPGRGAVALIQEGEHALRGLVSPYSTAANAIKKSDEPGVGGAAKAVARGIREQALDIKNPSAAASKWEKKVPINAFRDSNTRAKHGGSGPLEGLVDKAVGR